MKFDSQISGKHEGKADFERDSHANSVESAPFTKQIALAGVASLIMVVFVAALLKTLA